MAQEDRTTGLVGYSGAKVPVRVATTANITLNGLQTIDGIALAQDDRVLVKDQTDTTKNAIWVADTGDWNRAPDCDGPYDLAQGSLIFVNSGTTNGTSWFYCTTTAPVPDGSMAIAFALSSTALAVISAFMQTVVAQTTAALARSALGAAASGANTDITSVAAALGVAIPPWVAAGGTVSAITATYSPAVLALTDGMVLAFRASGANTSTTPTFAPNGLTAHTITKAGGSALIAGDIPAALAECFVRYNLANTRWELLNPAVAKQPTRTVLTSGTAATYTTPTGATRINVRLVGGGAGGGAMATNNGTAGNNTTFGTLTGGAGGQGSNGAGGANGGVGGTASGGDINIPGGGGQSGFGNSSAALQMAGGVGGASAFGGAGTGGAPGGAGGNAATNSGAGGGGAGASVSNNSAGGGGAGGYVEKLITAPSATYTYTVGAAANGGAAGTFAGGNGAAGIIIVDEFYN